MGHEIVYQHGFLPLTKRLGRMSGIVGGGERGAADQPRKGRSLCSHQCQQADASPRLSAPALPRISNHMLITLIRLAIMAETGVMSTGEQPFWTANHLRTTVSWCPVYALFWQITPTRCNQGSPLRREFYFSGLHRLAQLHYLH
jgi:hypothetical protein